MSGPISPNMEMTSPRPLTDQQLAPLLGFIAGQDGVVLLETSRPSTTDRQTLLFHAPVAVLTCTATDQPAAFFARAEEYLRQGCYLAGFFAYEFGYLLEPVLRRLLPADPATPLATLGVYGPPLTYDHSQGTFNRPPPWEDGAVRTSHSYSLANLRLSEPMTRYLASLQQIKEYIASGDTYQVNYTVKLRFDFSGSSIGLYAALRRNQSVAYSALLKFGPQQILSFSPELFFRKTGDHCTVRPMKGTVRRGSTPEEDRQLAEFLRNDPKNRSENVMIVDLLRNDLGRLCTQGAVKTTSMFDIETFETLHQMTSTIEGTLRPGLGLQELFGGLFPCGSVTGAPKIRTMEIIRELEGQARGVYTGAIGYLAPNGSAVFNVPIRTVTLRGSQGEMGIGSGVVFDSDPEREWRECQLKGSFLTRPTPPFRLIETLLWQPAEGYWLMDHHLERLMASADFLGFHQDGAAIRQQLAELAADFTTHQRVRLLLAKDGTIELAHTPCDPPASDPAAILAGSGALLPVTVVFSRQRLDSREPLRYHKTTLRSLYDQERATATAAGYYEVLFLNERDEVSEGAITNLFVQRQGKLLTPALSCGILPGVFRRHLLATAPIPVEEAILTLDDLYHAEDIYVGNAVRGLVRAVLAEPPFLAG